MKPTPPIESILIRIADSEYYVSCSEDQREGLERAAQYLDREIKSVMLSDRTMTLERSAVIVALTLADEFIKLTDQVSQDELGRRARALTEKIDAFLSEHV